MTLSTDGMVAVPLAQSGRPGHKPTIANARTSAVVPAAPSVGGSLPPHTACVAAAHTPLPLPTLVAAATRSSVHYAITAIDDRGRLGDTSAVGVLGWQPGLAVGFVLLPGAVGVVVDRGGSARLTGLGRLHLPVAVRRALHLRPGDRLLLAAHLEHDQLVAYTAAALDMMTALLHGTSHSADSA